MPEIRLTGCTPEPLLSYLKALGVFRLVAEQADAKATLSWRGGVAVLQTSLDPMALRKFFLEQCRPTPIVGPWGARSGFYPGSSESSARDALEAILATTDQRFEHYRATIAIVRRILNQLGVSVKKDLEEGDRYLRLLRTLRNELPDQGEGNPSFAWFETVCAITSDDRRFPPLLGTGGNEGSGSYVSSFAQVVCSLLVRRERDTGLTTALFDEFGSEVGGVAVGHFDPGALGGPNGTQGLSGGGGANVWDYLFGIEGTLMFGGSVARRLGSESAGRAGYSFCVDPVAVGYGSRSEKEAGDSTRAELWLPLWEEPCSLSELQQLFAEGRAQLGRRQAKNAVEFALAVSCMGVSRGLTSFVRYAFVMRYGLSYFAAPLGRFRVVPRPNARLLDDPPLTAWLDKLRYASRDKEKTPARYQAALNGVDKAMFAFCNRSEQGNDPPYLCEVVEAMGRAEYTLSHGLSFCKEKYIRPLQNLSPQWLDQANDGSREFRLAVSLAGIRRYKEVGSLRAYLEEVEVTKFVNWAPGSTSAVWTNQPLAANLAAVFRRRQMEAVSSGIVGVPQYSPRPARLADVIAFLNDEIDAEKLQDLLWGLIAVDVPDEFILPEPEPVWIPFAFGVSRLLVGCNAFVVKDEKWTHSTEHKANAIPDPKVFNALTTGRTTAVQDSVDQGARRLKSGGLIVTGYRNRRQSGQSLELDSPIRPERLLAAMLFPLSNLDLERIANAVLYPPESEE